MAGTALKPLSRSMAETLIRMVEENRKVRVKSGYSYTDVEYVPKGKNYLDHPKASTVYALHDRGLLDRKLQDGDRPYPSEGLYSVNKAGRDVVEKLNAEIVETVNELGYERVRPEAKKTTSPCPACGKSEGRRSTLVCRDCLEAIETAIAIRELAEALAGEGEFWEPVRVPDYHRAHDLPYRAEFEDPRSAQELMRDVLDAGSLPMEVSSRFAEKYRNGIQLIFREKTPYLGNSRADSLAPRGLFAALMRLEMFWRGQVAAAYNAGYQEGQQLLRQLSQGEVTLSEFEEKSARRKAVKD